MNTIYLLIYKQQDGYTNTLQFDSLWELSQHLEQDIHSTDKVVITTIQI